VEDIRKDLGITDADHGVESKLPEEEVTGFCLWLKDSLSEKISKVTLSKRLTNTPAIVVGEMSSSMFMMMQMLQSSGQLDQNS
jgi:HSP90 family molecular chaperone